MCYQDIEIIPRKKSHLKNDDLSTQFGTAVSKNIKSFPQRQFDHRTVSISLPTFSISLASQIIRLSRSHKVATKTHGAKRPSLQFKSDIVLSLSPPNRCVQ